MAFETWGAFSVTDHLEPKAFVADLLLYDRLVIPVPEGEERERWEELGRKPKVLDRKLEILEGGPAKRRSRSSSSLVQRVPWTSQLRAQLDKNYPDERRSAREGMISDAEAATADRVIVADWMKSAAETPDIVAAYTSYEAVHDDLKLGVKPPSNGLSTPNDPFTGVIGWKFFVPEDSTLNDDELLDKVVELVHRKKFRQARGDFYAWRREAIQKGASTEPDERA
jgi:hypothetical protein